MSNYKRVKRIVRGMCLTCLGTKRGVGDKPCATCNGTGETETIVNEIIADDEKATAI